MTVSPTANVARVNRPGQVGEHVQDVREGGVALLAQAADCPNADPAGDHIPEPEGGIVVPAPHSNAPAGRQPHPKTDRAGACTCFIEPFHA